MAAVAPISLILASSSSLRATSEAGDGSSPLGPFDSTVSCKLARAGRAAPITSASAATEPKRLRLFNISSSSQRSGGASAMWWVSGSDRGGPVQVVHAQPRALGGVGPAVKFGANPAVKAHILHRLKDRPRRHIPPIQRGEGEGGAFEPLQVDIADAGSVIADQLRRIATGCRKMRGVGAEIDRGQIK